MDIISKLPAKKGVIGPREISKGIAAGKIKLVVAASNCPAGLMEKMKSVDVKMFEGNEKELGTKLGKPFHVAVVGYD